MPWQPVMLPNMSSSHVAPPLLQTITDFKTESNTWWAVGVTEDEIKAGEREHLIHGAGPIKDLQALTKNNLLGKMLHFYTMRMPRRPVGCLSVLLRMLRSGMFYLSTDLMSYSGIEVGRLEVAWRGLIDPTKLLPDHISLLLTGKVSRNHKIPCF